MLKKLISLGIICSLSFGMHEIELNINDVDLEAGLKLDMGQFNQAVEPDTTFIGYKYLKGDKKNSADDISPSPFHEISFLIRRKIGSSDLSAGLGVKANITSLNRYDFVSIPIGLHLRYDFSSSDIPVYAGGYFYYAPPVLSSQDASKFVEYRVFLGVDIIKNAGLVVGFRNIDTTYDINGKDEKVNLNRSAYFGVRFRF